MIYFHKIVYTKRRLLCCLLFFVASCGAKKDNVEKLSIKENSTENEAKDAEDFNIITNAKKYVKQGDLILRTGRDFTSDVIRRMSLADKTYSHCGIASFENDTLFVYHAIGGEWNPDQKLRRDPFDFFCNPFENRGFGIFRYDLNDTGQQKLLTVIRNFYNKGIMFDMQFDLSTDDRMYCSEFVYKTIEASAGNKIKIPIDTLHSIKFVTVDNLFINPFCKQVKRIKFSRQ